MGIEDPIPKGGWCTHGDLVAVNCTWDRGLHFSCLLWLSPDNQYTRNPFVVFQDVCL